MNQKGKQFINDSDIDWQDLGGGVKRKIMSYDENLMMVKVSFETGGIGSLHNHVHRQISYVDSGIFEITIEENRKILKQGDAFFIPPNLVHGALCIERGTLIDIFTPFREDFISK
ncbi:cupin domain-containing protein [Dyadobacter frigoris]|uniref:Cupin domain-containing protein n=1 Tax=Dyadobacter frigoris TaxID=2576211 RepID=A0A4U6D423_9BACT|nr:cupin domain-containing protein [Dyadobacter frigoris]TKT91982.1 cupin domain-containing protein [Dyadobacter frigoris]GLU53144.1 cupin [Dyadobacter frigoris]